MLRWFGDGKGYPTRKPSLIEFINLIAAILGGVVLFLDTKGL